MKGESSTFDGRKMPAWDELTILSPTAIGRAPCGWDCRWQVRAWPRRESQPRPRASLILLSLKTGLRLEELIGLQWADLDLPCGKRNVRRTIWRGVVELPKGGRKRTVDLPASAAEALKAHRHLCGPYVFWQQDGQPLIAGML